MDTFRVFRSGRYEQKGFDRDKDYMVCVGYKKALVIMYHPSLAPQCRCNHCPATSRALPRETNSRNTAREGIKSATTCNNISYIQLVYKEGVGTNCFCIQCGVIFEKLHSF